MGIGVTIEMRVRVRLGAHGAMEFWVVVVGGCRVCRVWESEEVEFERRKGQKLS